jgi:cell division protein FtsZ
VASHADDDAEIIFGANIDDDLGEEMRVTVIAAGFERKRARPGSGSGRSSETFEIPSFVRG